jgi:hypothetical protein
MLLEYERLQPMVEESREFVRDQAEEVELESQAPARIGSPDHE